MRGRCSTCRGDAYARSAVASSRGRVEIRAKRIYDDAEPADGHRVLVDHIWPRGVSRERARLDEWAKELAPSDGLRKWFDHEPDRFSEFRRRYREELEHERPELDALRRRAEQTPVTILYAARDREHHH